MALTEERRNEIAWFGLLKMASHKTFQNRTLKEHCEELSNELGIKNDNDLKDFFIIIIDTVFSNALKGVWERKTTVPTALTVEKRNQMAWGMLVAERFKDGLRIGEYVRREIGNDAKKVEKFGVSKSEFREFVKLVLIEIYARTMASLQK